MYYHENHNFLSSVNVRETLGTSCGILTIDVPIVFLSQQNFYYRYVTTCRKRMLWQRIDLKFQI